MIRLIQSFLVMFGKRVAPAESRLGRTRPTFGALRLGRSIVFLGSAIVQAIRRLGLDLLADGASRSKSQMYSNFCMWQY